MRGGVIVGVAEPAVERRLDTDDWKKVAGGPRARTRSACARAASVSGSPREINVLVDAAGMDVAPRDYVAATWMEWP
jgi:regulator of RNase E activity RraA